MYVSPLDYLDSNAKNKYPFTIDSTMVDDHLNKLTNDCILDINIILTNIRIPYVNKHVEASLIKLGKLQVSADETELLTTFRLSIGNTEVDQTVPTSHQHWYRYNNQAVTYGDTVSFPIIFNNATGVVAEGVVRLTVGNFVNLPADAEYHWNNAPLKLEQTTIKLPVPVVNTLALYNTDSNGVRLSSPEAIISKTDTKYISEGTNLSFSRLPEGKLGIAVIGGAGKGLHDACKERDEGISTINELTADDNANFIVSTGDCYEFTQIPNGFKLDNVCTPRCTPEQIGNTASYINRLKDGTITINGVAENFYDELAAIIEDYENNILPELTKPFFKVKYKRYGKALSVIWGIYNPSDSPIPVNLNVSYTNTLGSGETKRTRGGIVEYLSTPYFTDTLDCNAVQLLEYTLVDTANSSVAVTSISGTIGDVTVYKEISG